MIAAIVICLLSILLVVSLYICYRLSRKLLQFDELFEMLIDEFDVNIRFFEKLLELPLFMNSPEIDDAHRNMRIMKVRLEEYANRMGETRGAKKEREEKQEEEKEAIKGPRPVVV